MTRFRGRRGERFRLPVIMMILLVMLSFGFSSLSCSKKTDSIVVGWSPFEHSALLYVAEDQRFFTENGIDLSLRKYDLPLSSVEAMLKGEVNLSIGLADFAMVGRVFRKDNIRVLANIDKSELIYLVGRKDRGIEQASDVRAKKVGITYGSASQFYFGRFLDLNGLRGQDVTLVDVRTPDEWVNAVVNGDIDAVVTGQPYVNSIAARLGANAVVWPAQSGQPLFTLVLSTDDWIRGHPELIGRFLRSLAQAEEFVFRHPAEAKAIVQKWLSFDAAYMETVWSQNQFSLSLDESLIAAMEDEARWTIGNNLTSERTVPNFLDYVYEGALAAIRPEAVYILR